MLQHECLLAKFGFETTENEASKPNVFGTLANFAKPALVAAGLLLALRAFGTTLAGVGATEATGYSGTRAKARVLSNSSGAVVKFLNVVCVCVYRAVSCVCTLLKHMLLR